MTSGKVTEFELSSAAISEGFRRAVYSYGCGIAWTNEYLDDILTEAVKNYSRHLYKFGKNMYYNEPDIDVVDWKNEFWFPHYDRLLLVKRLYDPQNLLTCEKCVGWDMNSSTSYGDIKFDSYGIPSLSALKPS